MTEQRATHPILWAFYLACSWTWVIGMWLPVILVRDYGLWGWVTFAVPNVVGAAAMGWVLRSRESAVEIIRRNAPAVRLFSAVTVSFQVFVLMWLIPQAAGVLGLPLVLPALLLAVSPPLARLVGRPVVAVVIWAISLTLFAALFSADHLSLPAVTGTQPTWHLVGLVPVCLLGFALNPYLDATFLRARADTDAGGARLAFGVGFGVLFFAMIVGTLLYAGFAGDGGLGLKVFGLILAAHLTVQVWFTVAAHTSAVGDVSPSMLVGVVAASLLGMVALRGDMADSLLFGQTHGEVIYRVYLGFYGLAFPAYVLLVMVRGASASAVAVTVTLALPLFAAGFILRVMPLSAVGVAVVLVAAWVFGRSRQGADNALGGASAGEHRPVDAGGVAVVAAEE